MSRRNAQFTAALLGLTLVVPGLLIVLSPLAEPRATFGTLVGWSLALLVMVPSYVLLTRADRSDDVHGFLRGYMLGTLFRLVVTVGATVLFVLFVADAPVLSYLLSFFLGYASLTLLELMLTLGNSHEGTSA